MSELPSEFKEFCGRQIETLGKTLAVTLPGSVPQQIQIRGMIALFNDTLAGDRVCLEVVKAGWPSHWPEPEPGQDS